MRKYKNRQPEQLQNPEESEYKNISYKKLTNNIIKPPKSTKNVNNGKLINFDYINKNTSKEKYLKSPKNEKNKIINDALYGDHDEKNIEEVDIEENNIPLMQVRKMSYKSKEMGKIRSTIKLKEKISDAEKAKESRGPLIDESKGKKAAESYYKKRQYFLKHSSVKTENDFRKNKLIIDNLKSKNETEGKLNNYLTIATDNINRGGNYGDKNKSYIVPGSEMKKFLAEGGQVKKKEEKPIINRRQYMGKYNSYNVEKENDELKNIEERNFANKYAKITKNNNDKFKTVDNENNNVRNNYYRRIKPNNFENKEIKEENFNKKIYVKKADNKGIQNNDSQINSSGYKRKYMTINYDNDKNELNQTDYKKNNKKFSENKYSRVKENKVEIPNIKASIRKKFIKKDETENNDNNNEKNEQKKIVVNTNAGFGRWKRY